MVNAFPHLTVLVALAALLGLAAPGCAQQRPPADAHAWVQQGATLLDVRTPEEFAAGHLPGAVNVPVQELGSRMAEIPAGKVVVYCRSGRRSATATELLREAGREVLDLGSMSAW